MAGKMNCTAVASITTAIQGTATSAPTLIQFLPPPIVIPPGGITGLPPGGNITGPYPKVRALRQATGLACVLQGHGPWCNRPGRRQQPTPAPWLTQFPLPPSLSGPQNVTVGINATGIVGNGTFNCARRRRLSQWGAAPDAVLWACCSPCQAPCRAFADAPNRTRSHRDDCVPPRQRAAQGCADGPADQLHVLGRRPAA